MTASGLPAGTPPSGLRVALALVFGLVSLAILLALGTWQVQRLHWKEGLLAQIQSRVHAAPVTLADVLNAPQSIADQEYRPVRLEGTFVHAAERHFFATHDGASGYFVYTPLHLASGDYIFVNRGFVPFDRKGQALRAQGQVTGEVAIVGLVRAGLVEKPSWAVPDNDPAKNIFYWKDIRAMAETAGLPKDAKVLGFFVDADATPNPGGLPVGGVTLLDLPNNHLQYAVTWYGLALALVGVLGAWLWRGHRARKAPRP